MTMKLKITNTTRLSGRDLRKLTLQTLRHFAPDAEWYYVEFYRLRRGTRTKGWGRVGTNRMRVGIEPEWEKNSLSDSYTAKLRIVNTIAHEIEHNEGAYHKDMVDCGLSDWTLDDVPWIKDIHVGVKPAKLRLARQDRANRREAHARTMLAKAERKLKLAKTVLKRWKTKVAYYDRKKAASRSE